MHLVNTILNQPNRRRVSTDRLNCEYSQLAASLEGESSSTPAGKSLAHSYPKDQVSEGEGTRYFYQPDMVAYPSCGQLNRENEYLVLK